MRGSFSFSGESARAPRRAFLPRGGRLHSRTIFLPLQLIYGAVRGVSGRLGSCLQICRVRVSLHPFLFKRFACGKTLRVPLRISEKVAQLVYPIRSSCALGDSAKATLAPMPNAAYLASVLHVNLKLDLICRNLKSATSVVCIDNCYVNNFCHNRQSVENYFWNPTKNIVRVEGTQKLCLPCLRPTEFFPLALSLCIHFR